MWVAKIQLSNNNTLIGEMCDRYKVSLVGYPLLSFFDGKELLVQISGTLYGKSENKEAFYEQIGNDSDFINYETNGDFLIGLIRQPLYTRSLFDPEIFHVSPIQIFKDGYQFYTLGGFNQDKMMDIVKMVQDMNDANLIYFKEEKMRTLSITKVIPELTKKQHDAISLAIEKGYYQHPRRVNLQDLARIAGVTFSTFHAHLRKAEEQLIPYNFEKTDIYR